MEIFDHQHGGLLARESEYPTRECAKEPLALLLGRDPQRREASARKLEAQERCDQWDRLRERLPRQPEAALEAGQALRG